MTLTSSRTKKRVIIASLMFHIALAALALIVVKSVYSAYKFGAYGHKGARVYYDAVHGARHLWNRDNARYRSDYHTISGFYRFFQSMKQEGFEPHAETYKNFDRMTLSFYDVFFVGEQTYHGRFMTEADQKVLMDWVKDGGGLFVLAEHTNAHYMDENVNALFRDAPVKARFDAICDNIPANPSWLPLKDMKPHPVTQGVGEYHFFNGCSLDTPHGIAFSSPTSWSDKYNPENEPPVHNGNKRKDSDELSGPLAGIAAFEYGKGRVVVIGDHNAISNIHLYYADHYKLIFNALTWLAGDRINPDIFTGSAALLLILLAFALKRKRFSSVHLSAPSLAGVAVVVAAIVILFISLRERHYNFFVHTGNNSTMNYITKSISGYHSTYGHWTKEPQLNPWTHDAMKPGYDALFLSGPTAPYSQEQLAIIDQYLLEGKTVAYLATVASLNSNAGEQLMSKFGFSVETNLEIGIRGKTSFNAYGPRQWMDGIFRLFVHGNIPGITARGMTPIITLTRGSYRAANKSYLDKTVLFHVLSEKRFGRGRFWMVAPMELFDDRSLRGLYLDSDVVRQQAGELMIRLIKQAVHDNSVQFHR